MSAGTDKNCLALFRLQGGLNAELLDETSHYFGGYFHVRIRVQVDIPLDYTSITRQISENVKAIPGQTIRFERVLERMAVSEAELDQSKKELIDAFVKHSLPYLQREGFVESFLAAELESARKRHVGRSYGRPA